MLICAGRIFHNFQVNTSETNSRKKVWCSLSLVVCSKLMLILSGGPLIFGLENLITITITMKIEQKQFSPCENNFTLAIALVYRVFTLSPNFSEYPLFPIQKISIPGFIFPIRESEDSEFSLSTIERVRIP